MGTAPLAGFAEALNPAACAQTARALAPVFSASAVEITGQQIPIDVGSDEVACGYAPLAMLAHRLGQQHGRALVALAGPPGSGKSIMATLLTQAVAALDAERDVRPAWIGLDGFHLPNAALDSRTVEVDGQAVAMRLYKGAEFTFDAPAAKVKFQEIAAGLGRPVAAPAYDRRRHEPAPDAVRVPAECRLVFVEGNYLLLAEDEWQGAPDLFDLRVYIDMAEAGCKPGLIARHLRGGRGPDDAERHYQRVDLRNRRVIEATRPRADLVVQKAAGHRVAGVLVQNPARIREIAGP